MHLQKTPQTSSRSAFNRSRVDGRLTMGGGGRISLAPDARYSIASGAPSNFRPSAFPGAASRRLVTVPRVLKIQDSRNLRDREVQSDMIRKIVSFLEDSVNPLPSFKVDDRDFLRNPSRNHFRDVFEFIFQCVQPNYQLQTNPPNKFNEEVVHLMNGLGYPYHLKNSTMQTMTSPTTWPLMLAVLEWLVNFVELELTLHEDRRVGDQEKWQLYVSCFKKSLEMKAQSVKTDPAHFGPEFEAYRNSKLGIDGGDYESYEELRTRRLEFDDELERIRNLIAEEENSISNLKKSISGTDDDIKVLEKYAEELLSVIAKNNCTMAQCEENIIVLNKKNEEFEAKRLAKEDEISKQKMTGDEARQLFNKRKQINEEISTTTTCFLAESAKYDGLQPKYFKNSAKVNTDYKSIIGRLLHICKAFDDSEELQQQIQQYSFLGTIMDFKKSSVENKLTQMIQKFKESAETKIASYQRFVEDSTKRKADLLKEIDELNSAIERCLECHELENERFKRELGDEFRPVRAAKHNLDIAKQKHQQTSSEMDKYNLLLNSIGEELADKHKKYIQYKQSLDEIYDEFQSVLMDNMTKLCNRFERQHKQKMRLSEIAETILKENNEMIKKLDSEGGQDDNLMCE